MTWWIIFTGSDEYKLAWSYLNARAGEITRWGEKYQVIGLSAVPDPLRSELRLEYLPKRGSMRNMVKGDTAVFFGAGDPKLAKQLKKKGLTIRVIEAGLRGEGPEAKQREKMDRIADILQIPGEPFALERVQRDPLIKGQALMDYNYARLAFNKVQMQVGLDMVSDEKYHSAIFADIHHTPQGWNQIYIAIEVMVGPKYQRRAIWTEQPSAYGMAYTKDSKIVAPDVIRADKLSWVEHIAYVRGAQMILTDCPLTAIEAFYLNKPLLIARKNTFVWENFLGKAVLVDSDKTEILNAFRRFIAGRQQELRK